LTDAQGRTASGEHAIFILTSNIPLETRDADHPVGFAPSREPPKKQREDLRQLLKGYFRVEFLNRLDEVVVFRALSTEDCLAITRLKLAWVQKRAAERACRWNLIRRRWNGLPEPDSAGIWGALPGEHIDQYVNQQLGRLMCAGNVAIGSARWRRTGWHLSPSAAD
jgi:ATP-dependent Clp protease ATP-binding subunit ClpA